MASQKFKFVTRDVDRHGNVRYYFRRKGEPKIRLYGDFGSEAFTKAYYEARASGRNTPKATNKRTPVGSFGYVCLQYLASPVFRSLDSATQKQRRYFLESICEKHGSNPIAAMRSHHVDKLLETKRHTPAAARNFLKSLNALFRWALRHRMVDSDPTKDVEPIPYSTEGHHTWTEQEIAIFEARHPVGTRPRLAMALMLYTGCRREDVVRLGPQHIKNGRLRYTQAKNEDRNPVHIDVEVHQDLLDIIAKSHVRHMTFLTTAYGKPFSAAGFGNWFRDRCNEAGLINCSSHGLRKRTAVQLAEGGATSQEIMAVTGHKSLSEVERYTKAASKAKLADSAMKKFKRRT